MGPKKASVSIVPDLRLFIIDFHLRALGVETRESWVAYSMFPVDSALCHNFTGDGYTPPILQE